MRAYLPLVLSELREVSVSGRLPQRQGFAVTDGVRAMETDEPGADEEDFEFEAMCQALDAARALGPGRRVVASAEVAAAAGTGSDAALDDALTVALSEVVSFHIEESEGSVGSGYDDLLWYDVTELSELTRADG